MSYRRKENKELYFLQELFYYERFWRSRCFSDGKYNITNDFGGTLYEHIGKQPAIDLMEYVDEINMKYGGEGTKLYSTAGTKLKRYACRTSSSFWMHQSDISELT